MVRAYNVRKGQHAPWSALGVAIFLLVLGSLLSLAMSVVTQRHEAVTVTMKGCK